MLFFLQPANKTLGCLLFCVEILDQFNKRELMVRCSTYSYSCNFILFSLLELKRCVSHPFTQLKSNWLNSIPGVQVSDTTKDE